MELTITNIIQIDIDEIIRRVKKGGKRKHTCVELVIDNYVNEMDDCDYYLIGHDEKVKILAEVKKRLNKITPISKAEKIKIFTK